MSIIIYKTFIFEILHLLQFRRAQQMNRFTPREMIKATAMLKHVC